MRGDRKKKLFYQNEDGDKQKINKGERICNLIWLLELSVGPNLICFNVMVEVNWIVVCEKDKPRLVGLIYELQGIRP